MSKRVEHPVITVIAGEDLNAYCRVKFSAEDTVSYADAADYAIGVTEEAVSSGDKVAVRLHNATGTLTVRAAGAFAALATIYGAADGEVDDVAAAPVAFGYALEAATAAHDEVEVLAFTFLAANTKTRQHALQKFLKNDLVTPLPNAGDATNLGLVAGTHGTHSPTLQGTDFGGTTATETARTTIEIPADYVAGGDLTLTFHAGVLTTVSDNLATLDVQAYEPDGEAGVSADLCATAAQSINSLTMAAKAFTITGTALEPGDVLDVEITTVGTDGGNLGVMKTIVGEMVVSYTGRP